MDDSAKDQFLDETFRELVLGFQAMADYRVQADGFHPVIVIVRDDAERGRALDILAIGPPGIPGLVQILRVNAGFQDFA